MDGDWDEVARLALPPPGRHAVPTPIATMAFDTTQELLWVGNDYGRVSSFYSTDLQIHTSYKAHDSLDGPVKVLLFNDRGVISLGPRSVHMATRRGIPIWHIAHEDMKDLQCMSFTSKGTGEIIVAGMCDQMFVIDVHRGEITKKLHTSHQYTIMKRSRYICAATSKGAVNLLDPITFNIVKTWNAHTSMINDLDAQHDFIVTCGYSLRQGNNYMLDPLVNVFDLKNMASLPPIPFPAGAAYVRMHPRMSTTSIVVSQLGQMHIVDLMNVNTSNVRQANVLTYLTMIEIAPSGEAVALADSECNVHLWGSPSRIRFAEVSNPVEFANPEENHAPMDWDLATPLNTIGMPYYREPLLSAWPTHLVSDVGAPPEKIDPKFLSTLTTIEYGAYGRNPKTTKRNQSSNTRTTEKPGCHQAPKFLSEKARESQGSSGGGMERRISDVADALGAAEISSLKAEVPFMYRNVEIKYSKFGVDDFDFGFYNKTRYSGLETHISNSYANPVLQLLHYTPLIRNMALQHAATSCLNPLCLLCEMGFLFDMLEKAEGCACQATNLLKAFSNHPEAARLGLLEEEAPTASLAQMLQGLTRLLMEKLAQDFKSIAPHSEAFNQTLATSATTTIRCMNCRSEHTRPGTTFVTELTYPPPKTAGRISRTPKVSFSQVLKLSVEREATSRGWCSRCQRYQSLATRKTIHNVPPVLVLNTQIATPEAKTLWGTPGWLPDEIGIIVDNGGQFFCYEGEDLRLHLQRGMHNITVCSLIGLAADIESGQHQKSHLVSLVNVAHAQPDPEVTDNWHLFNDFLVRPVKKEEAISFNTSWKQPCVITFQAKSENNKIDDSWKQSLDTSLLHNDLKYIPHFSFSHWHPLPYPHMCQNPEFCYRTGLIHNSYSPHPTKSYTPLSETEMPAAGSVIALDTEFVSIRQPEIEVNSDGDRETIRPIVYALARVSVLRGPGPLGSFDVDLEPGTPFIDDYITLTSPVVDYLTSYSGIKTSDLDPAVSPHSLVPLKTAYKKLWLLLNLGCSFLGHGLKQDFRVINIHVPKSQVIDTAEFFFLPNRLRKLSLAFLAWYLLKEEIQLETHDSIEDARTALKLWGKWKEFVDAGVQENMLSEIYRVGREVGFKPPGRGEGSAVVFSTPTKAN